MANLKRIVAVVALAAPCALAIGAQGQAPGVVAVTPGEIKYETTGLAMAGMSQANLVGDPGKPGRYTIRLTFPDGYKLAPHSHPDSREVTILSGTWLTGYGETFDPARLKALPAGSFYTEPANMPHFVQTKGAVEIQVSGTGPSSRQFVAPPAAAIPAFQLDPSWPKKLPNKWVFGSVSGINIDAQDHIWVITRPREKVNAAQKAGVAAPPVVELDAAGNFIRGWGGPGTGYEWFDIEHGITVDGRGFVWIAGSGREQDDQILKFTRDGKFVMQIGKRGQNKGNTDTTSVRGAADVTHYAPTNEIFVADGYVNRRVIVFDADTGAYKRMWGAFGNTPTDVKPGETPAATPVDVNTEGPGPQQFSNGVHGIRVSKDGFVYVCDRQNQRIQVFTIDGKYVSQVFISRGVRPASTAAGTLFGRPRREVEAEVISSNQSASRTAFSPDPEQRFLYVLDRRRQQIAILERKTLEILGYFGGGIGDAPGQFYILHDMATDSKGNFYTAEINQNGRAQKFAFTGMGSTAR